MDKKRNKNEEPKPGEKFDKLLEIKHYLEKGTFPSNTLKSNKNSLKQFAKRFVLQDEILFHLSQRHGKRMAILNELNTHSIISDCHQDPDGSHYGLVTTFATVSRNYYWPTMWLDTRTWVMNCPVCQLPPDSLPESYYPKNRWETLLLDYIGPFPRTSNDHQHLLLCMDVFTRYAVVCPMVDASAEQIALTFCEYILYVYGQCSNLVIIQRDAPSQKIYNEIVFTLTMGETMTPIMQQQASNIDLAKFQFLKSTIEIFMNEAPNNWELYVKDFVFTYNTIKDTTTLESPFYLMFLRHPLPLEGDERNVNVSSLEDVTNERINESRKKTIKWFEQKKASNQQLDYSELN